MANKDNKTEDKNAHICGARCSIFSRICGYYRPVTNWNIGKREEFKDRVTFTVPQNSPTCHGK